MLRIVAKNDALQNILDLFSERFVDDFFHYVNTHRAIKRHRYPVGEHDNQFVFWYRFYEDRNLIVLEAFSQRHSSEIIFGDSLKDELLTRQIYNKYMDNGLYID